MHIGVPSEIKNNEYRVAMTPAGVVELLKQGHVVPVEQGAGEGSGISTESYRKAGARIAEDVNALWNSAELIVKVKEPIEPEYVHFRPDLILFTFLHLAAAPQLANALLSTTVTAIAYETLESPSRTLPLLAPMSEVAGRLAPLVGANVMLRPHGRSGLLLPGVPGTHRGNVLVIGAGVAGTGAIGVAVGIGANVTVLDTNIARLRELDALYHGRINTAVSNSYTIQELIPRADLVIGAVLIPGARAPRLVTNDMVKKMKAGSVLVDIAIDQGGCFEDSRPTTHDAPTFPVHNSLFYCVANMPGAVPQTSTHALTNATLSYVSRIAARGWRDAIFADPYSRPALNIHDGKIVNQAVAFALGIASDGEI